MVGCHTLVWSGQIGVEGAVGLGWARCGQPIAALDSTTPQRLTKLRRDIRIPDSMLPEVHLLLQFTRTW
jgi:hypothetical protein